MIWKIKDWIYNCLTTKESGNKFLEIEGDMVWDTITENTLILKTDSGNGLYKVTIQEISIEEYFDLNKKKG